MISRQLLRIKKPASLCLYEMHTSMECTCIKDSTFLLSETPGPAAYCSIVRKLVGIDQTRRPTQTFCSVITLTHQLVIFSIFAKAFDGKEKCQGSQNRGRGAIQFVPSYSQPPHYSHLSIRSSRFLVLVALTTC